VVRWRISKPCGYPLPQLPQDGLFADKEDEDEDALQEVDAVVDVGDDLGLSRIPQPVCQETEELKKPGDPHDEK